MAMAELLEVRELGRLLAFARERLIPARIAADPLPHPAPTALGTAGTSQLKCGPVLTPYFLTTLLSQGGCVGERSHAPETARAIVAVTARLFDATRVQDRWIVAFLFRCCELDLLTGSARQKP